MTWNSHRGKLVAQKRPVIVDRKSDTGGPFGWVKRAHDPNNGRQLSDFPIDNYWPLLATNSPRWLVPRHRKHVDTLDLRDNVEDRSARAGSRFSICLRHDRRLDAFADQSGFNGPVGRRPGAIAGVLALICCFSDGPVVVLFPIFFLPLFFEVPAFLTC